MLGTCPRSSLHRTCIDELHTQRHVISHLPPSDDEKAVLQPPHQIVIGFDLGADKSRSAVHAHACGSPRSVLESQHLCFRSLHQPARSPRSPLSVLGSLLSGGHPGDTPCTQGAALCIKVAVNAEEATVGENAHPTFSRGPHVARNIDGADGCHSFLRREFMADHSNDNMQSRPVTFSRLDHIGFRKNWPQNHGPSGPVHSGSRANPPSTTFLGSDCDKEDNDAPADDDEDRENVNKPVFIFATVSPVSNSSRCDSLAVDFLSKCFLCRRHLVQGKDIYMYRGDRAFCSEECRYQQIVVDERKEKCPGVVTCVSGAATHQQRVGRATQATVA